jgi:phosphonate transport system substrate-binding protein
MRGILRLFVGALFILSAAAANAAQEARFAITDVVGLENLQREWGAFRDILSAKTGLDIKFYPVPSRTAAVEALNAKHVDFVLTGPAEYVVFRSRTNAVPVVGLTRPDYFPTLVTIAGKGINTVHDLKGKKVAFGDVGSTSRHLGPAQILADQGLDLTRDIQTVHLNRNVAVEAMKRGDLQAIAANHTDLPGIKKRFPDVTFVTIGRGRDLPSDVLLAGPHVDKGQIDNVRKVFVDHSDELIAAVLKGPDENQKYQGMHFFSGISDADYNYVRAMYRTIGQQQFSQFLGD